MHLLNFYEAFIFSWYCRSSSVWYSLKIHILIFHLQNVCNLYEAVYQFHIVLTIFKVTDIWFIASHITNAIYITYEYLKEIVAGRNVVGHNNTIVLFNTCS